MIKWNWCNNGWKDADSEDISLEEIIETISNKKYEVHVGCDSHKIGGRYIFATVIAAYEPGKGGTYFFKRHKTKDSALNNLSVRLLKEAEFSIVVSNKLRKTNNSLNITVHLDINPNKKYASSKFLTSAVSWVKSSGYECLVKPQAWASSSLADAYAK